MTNPHHAPADGDRREQAAFRISQLATELAVRLAELGGEERHRQAERVASLPAPVAPDPPLADSGITRPSGPLAKASWATGAGSGAGVQRLDVAVVPGLCPIAHTASATGRELVTNGYLGAD